MRLVPNLVVALCVASLAVGSVPVSTEPAHADPAKDAMAAIDGSGGSPGFGAFLWYRSGHPSAGHCDYAYSVRVAGEIDLPRLWDLWRFFALDPMSPPPGVVVDFEGYILSWDGASGGYTVPAIRKPFDGLALEVSVDPANWRGLGSISFVRPSGEGALVSDDLVRALPGTPSWFLVTESFCL